MENYRVAFAGGGAMAQAHAFALKALPHYYPDVPDIALAAVATAMPDQQNLAHLFGCPVIHPDALWPRDDIDAVFILSSNNNHYPYLKRALAMKNVQRIYLEKPVCVFPEEEREITDWIMGSPLDKVVQVGFQYLQMPTVRYALRLWQEARLGDPIHFHVRYLHSSYLQPDYRQQRRSRLKPLPENGAVVDLGSHALSLLTGFLGEALEVAAARQSGSFPDVPAGSDLCTLALMRDAKSGAIGTLTASRISCGAGDLLEFELRGTQGAFKLSTQQPDLIEVFNDKEDGWTNVQCGSDYRPASSFPARHAPSGWFRPLIHAHYLFFGGVDPWARVPDLRHALSVQRLIHRIAAHLAT